MKMTIKPDEWVILVEAVISEEKNARDFATKLNSSFHAEQAERFANVYKLLLSDSVTLGNDDQKEDEQTRIELQNYVNAWITKIQELEVIKNSLEPYYSDVWECKMLEFQEYMGRVLAARDFARILGIELVTTFQLCPA